MLTGSNGKKERKKIIQNYYLGAPNMVHLTLFFVNLQAAMTTRLIRPRPGGT
jgi:hypothetical protein